jgi:proteasome lid subunit RPN8/RPN11
MARDQNYRLKAIYHSHPEHKAYFSKQDYAMATFDHEPMYPGTKYIIVSIINKKVKEAICFYWDNKSKEFLEGEILQTY